ncbi:MAG: hypothetical protein IPH84_00065 [Bacteroidales bacterium]|nr:hypothetical protein [Bacteroidales bacterium]
MLQSTNEYNLNPAHGITLGGTSAVFKQSSPIQSEKFPGSSYHYEFMLNGGNLYACLHCAHHSPHHNLSLLIRSLIPLIAKRLAHNDIIGFDHVPITGLPPATHVVNILVRKYGAEYPAQNAEIMRHLINVTQSYHI